MQSIPNVATQDGYVDALTLGPDATATQLVYVVANAAVYAQFRPQSADGTVLPFGPEVLLTPTANTVQRCSGCRFKSAVAGTPARVVAQLLEPADPQFGGGVPFASTLAASGGLTPGVASVQVEKDGVLIGQEAALNFIGTNWTIADNGALGRIDITPGASGLVPIADSILLADAASLTFSAIPQTYKHLKIEAQYRNNPSANSWLLARYNGDTNTRYGGQSRINHAATPASNNYGDSGAWICLGWNLAWFESTFYDYTRAINLTQTSRFGNTFDTSTTPPPTGADGFESGEASGYTTDALLGPITSIQLFTASGAALKTGSRFTLYGMA